MAAIKLAKISVKMASLETSDAQWNLESIRKTAMFTNALVIFLFYSGRPFFAFLKMPGQNFF